MYKKQLPSKLTLNNKQLTQNTVRKFYMDMKVIDQYSEPVINLVCINYNYNYMKIGIEKKKENKRRTYIQGVAVIWRGKRNDT